MINLYTDGACSDNGGVLAMSGWGYCAVDMTKNKIILEGYASQENGTNNIAELSAMIDGIQAIRRIYPFEKINVISDSNYCIRGVTEWSEKWVLNDWYRDARKKNPVANAELWQELLDLVDNNMEFLWVKGHSGVKWNEYVDKLARKGIEEARQEKIQEEILGGLL